MDTCYKIRLSDDKPFHHHKRGFNFEPGKPLSVETPMNPVATSQLVIRRWPQILLDKVRSNKSLMTEGLWLVGGQGVAAIGTLVGVRLLTDAIPPAVFGSVNLLMGILVLGRNLFCLPFFQASLRYYSEVACKGEVGTLRRVVLGYINRSNVLLTILTVVFGVGFNIGRQPTDLILVPVLISLLVVENLRTVETDLLNAARRQRSFSVLKMGEAWLKPLLALMLVAICGQTPLAVLFGYLSATIFLYVCLFGLRSGRVGIDVSEGPELVVAEAELRSKIWRFGWPLMPIAILEWISLMSDRYLIGGLVGSAEAGIYIAAYGLVTQPCYLAVITMELIFRPHYFEAIGIGDERRAKKIFGCWFILMLALYAIGVTTIFFFSEPIAAICLGIQYRGAAHLMPFIAVGSAMSCLGFTIEKIFHARQQTRHCLVIRLTGAVLSLLIGIPMILAYGVAGAAWAVPIYYGVQLMITLAIVRVSTKRSHNKIHHTN